MIQPDEPTRLSFASTAEDYQRMSQSDTVNAKHCLFVGFEIPDKLREWCRHQGIQGLVLELFDGGGTTCVAIEFIDSATKNYVAAHFDQVDRNSFIGEAIHSHGPLWREE